VTATALEIVAKLLGGALFAIVPTLISRGSFRRVCEFSPRFSSIYLAFLVGGLATIAWGEVISFFRNEFIAENFGIVVVYASALRLLGSLALIIAAVAYLIRDEKGKPIGMASATIVTLLTLVLTAPIGLAVFLISAFLFMPTIPH
jgi:hypothetical protein